MLWSEGPTLYARRLSTGVVASHEIPLAMSIPCMDVSGDSAAILTTDNLDQILPVGRLLTVNLTSGDLREVEPNGFMGCPALDGTNLVYNRFVGIPNAFLKDLATNSAPVQLSTGASGTIDTSAGRIVWSESRDGVADQLWLFTQE